MSEYFIQQQLLSENTRTLVKNEKGASIYLLVGRWGTRGDALSLYAMNGDIVASIKQTSFTAGARFELYQNFEKVGVMNRLLTFSRDYYYIQQLHWAVVGDIRNHHYSIFYKTQTIMDMMEATLISGDYYVLSVSEDRDAPICICIASVLNYWLVKRSKGPLKGLKKQLDWTID